MGLLFLCIVCNVLLAVVFKFFEKYRVDNLNAIIVNYFVCLTIGSIAVGEFIIPSNFFELSWMPYSFILALLFIFGFNLLGYSFQKAGVALTAIVAKMSLILSAGFPILFYSESLTLLKALGLLAGIVAILLVNRPAKGENSSVNWKSIVIILPLLVWLLSGLIEILLFYVQVEGYVTGSSLVFVSTSFGIAGFFGLFYSAYRAITSRIVPNRRDVIGGIVLGLPNFLSIFLLLYLLEKGWEGSTLFPLNNIGILLITSLIGWWFYKEKMSTMKVVGLILSVIAIVFISSNLM